jgi:hypothetical protein
MLLIANAESSLLFEVVTSLYMYTNAEKFRGDHCVRLSNERRINFQAK